MQHWSRAVGRRWLAETTRPARARACARYGVLVVGEEMKGLVSPAPKSESRRTDSLIDKRLEIAPIQPERICSSSSISSGQRRAYPEILSAL